MGEPAHRRPLRVAVPLRRDDGGRVGMYRGDETQMKPVRRVVTGHREGKAVVLFDSAAPNQKLRQASGLVSTLLWLTEESPADISGGADRSLREIGVPPPPGG